MMPMMDFITMRGDQLTTFAIELVIVRGICES